MQAHIVIDGVVVNTVMVQSLDFEPPGGGQVIDGSVGSVGWLYDGAQLYPPRATAEPLTRERVEEDRLHAYADPITGSDRYFAEAIRMQAMELPGWEAVRAVGVARYVEIQAANPYPE